MLRHFLKHVFILALKAATDNTITGMRPKFPEIDRHSASAQASGNLLPLDVLAPSAQELGFELPHSSGQKSGSTHT